MSFVKLMLTYKMQKQPSRGVLKKRCSENSKFTGERPCHSAISKKFKTFQQIDYLALNYVNTTVFYRNFVTNFEHIFVVKIVSSFYFKGV